MHWLINNILIVGPLAIALLLLAIFVTRKISDTDVFRLGKRKKPSEITSGDYYKVADYLYLLVEETREVTKGHDGRRPKIRLIGTAYRPYGEIAQQDYYIDIEPTEKVQTYVFVDKQRGT